MHVAICCRLACLIEEKLAVREQRRKELCEGVACMKMLKPSAMFNEQMLTEKNKKTRQQNQYKKVNKKFKVQNIETHNCHLGCKNYG